MAVDAEGRFLGNDELLHVATTEPTAPHDPADPAYTVVGFLTNNPFEGTSEETTIADKNVSSGGFKSKIPGSKDFSVNAEANRQNIGDAGQLIMRDAWLAGDTIWFLIAGTDDGAPTVAGAASVTTYSQDSPVDAPATMSARLSGQGPPAFGTVPAA